MSAHLAEPLSHCPFTTPSQTYVTSCLRKRLLVHLRGWGGSNPAAICWSRNLKKVLFSNTHLLQGLNNVGTKQGSKNHQSALWQASRTSIQKITSVAPLVLPWIKQKITSCFHFLYRPQSMKTRVWCEILLVQLWLPKSSKPPIQSSSDWHLVKYEKRYVKFIRYYL